MININKNSFIIEPEINGCTYYFYDGNVQYVRDTVENNVNRIKNFIKYIGEDKIGTIYVNDLGYGNAYGLIYYLKLCNIKFEICSKRKYI